RQAALEPTHGDDGRERAAVRAWPRLRTPRPTTRCREQQDEGGSDGERAPHLGTNLYGNTQQPARTQYVPATKTGTALLIVLPSPCWPKTLLPQQYAGPATLRPQA